MLLFTLLACGTVSTPATPPPGVDAPCAWLEAVSVPDAWALPGTDTPGATDARRTRVLEAGPGWATRCVVQRLGGVDVGPSCVASGLDRPSADALYGQLAEGFRSCHAGWTLSELADDTSREIVAERGLDLRFVRIRVGDPGWEVSLGAMPTP